jgi:hypothetical protein
VTCDTIFQNRYPFCWECYSVLDFVTIPSLPVGLFTDDLFIFWILINTDSKIPRLLLQDDILLNLLVFIIPAVD